MGLKWVANLTLAVLAFVTIVAAGFLELGSGKGSVSEVLNAAPRIMVDRIPGYCVASLVALLVFAAFLIACREWFARRSLWAACALSLGVGFSAPLVLILQLDFIASEVAQDANFSVTFYLTYFLGPLLFLIGVLWVAFSRSDQSRTSPE